MLSKADEGKAGARRTQAVMKHEGLESKDAPPVFGQDQLSDGYKFAGIGNSPSDRASSFGNKLS